MSPLSPTTPAVDSHVDTHYDAIVYGSGAAGLTCALTLAQQGLVGHMDTPVDVTYLADAVILFRYFETSGQLKKAISVVKKRSGRHEDTIRELKLDSQGVQVGKPLHDFRGILSGTPEQCTNQEASI